MKRFLVFSGIGMLVVGGILYGTLSTQEVYERNVETQIVIEKEIVSPLDEKIRVAQEQARAEIEQKARQAYNKYVEQALLEVELEERKSYRLELEAVEKEKAKQSISY